MSVLIPLDQATATDCGGKADNLRRLLQGGLPVPQGVCLPLAVYRRALPAELPTRDDALSPRQIEARCRDVRRALSCWQPSPELLRELGRLSWPRVVRSSASCEDGPASAPGLFRSVLGVSDPQRAVAAIRSCWASLWSVAAWLVLRRHGRWPGGEAMGVLLQRQVAARHAGLALSRGGPDPGVVQVELVQGGADLLADGRVDPLSLSVPRRGEPGAVPPLSGAKLRELRDAALAAEQIVGDPAELEWALDEHRLWLVQARRSTAAAVGAASPAPGPGWRWDREHNPEPLSPAHASLIEILDPTGASLRVDGGYLFELRRPGQQESPPVELAIAWDQLDRESRQLPPDEGRDPATGLRRVLERFTSFCGTYFGELAGARRRARRQLEAFLGDRGVERPGEAAARLAATREHGTHQRLRELQRLAARAGGDPQLRGWLEHEDPTLAGCPSPSYRAALERHVERYGTLFPVWDVAAPTLGERPELLLRWLRAQLDVLAAPEPPSPQQLERRVSEGFDAADRAALQPLLQQARLARRLEEDDDLLFSRALWQVRRGLLAVGRWMAERGWLERDDHVFFLTIPEVQRCLDSGQAPPGPAVRQQRRQRQQDRRGRPPTVAAARPAGPVLRGHGVGGTARGPVRVVQRLEQLWEQSFDGAVVVCPTLLPSLAVVLPEVAALITDHGGLLSHAASLARELGVVAVVGTGAATRELREGEVVWVDGKRGLVVREEG